MWIRSTAIGLMVAWMCGAAFAQTVQRIEVLDYGLYCLTEVMRKPDARAVSGRTAEVKDIELILATRTVPARIGIAFGFHYKIIGQPDGAIVEIRKVTRAPEPGVRNPQNGKTMLRGEILRVERIAGTSYRGFQFDDDWELVAGTWTFELWVGDKMFASQSFDVVTSAPALPGDRPPASRDGCPAAVSETDPAPRAPRQIGFLALPRS